MCGLLFIRNREGKACKAIQRRFRQQKERGVNGFGYLTVKNGMIEHVARSTNENGIMDALKKETSNTILFHHRTPTSTENYEEVTHPFFISDERFKHDYYIIHNGVISNWEVLYEKYKKDGYRFLTEMKEYSSVAFPNIENSLYEFDEEIKINDSETLAINLAQYFEGMTDTIEARGTIAFIAVKATKDGKVLELIYGHNGGNPLTLEKDKTVFALRSKGGKDLPVDIMYFMDWNTGDTVEKEVKIGEFYGRRTGFNTDKRSPVNVPSREIETEVMNMWEDMKGNVRHLHPDHPALPPKQLAAPLTDGMREMTDAYERSVHRDDDREYGDPQYAHDADSDFDGPSDEIEYGDITEIIAETEVERVLFEGVGESDQVKELRKDLRKTLYELRGASIERDEARGMCLLAAKAYKEGKHPITELEAAKSILQTANKQFDELRKEVLNITSELSAWQ